MNIRTDVSRKAQEIFRDIEPKALSGEKFLVEYEIGDNVVRVQTRLRQLMSEKCLSFRIWTAIDGGKLFIRNRTGVNQTPREHELSQMVRKLALHIDNDKLYEEALALVGTI